jgi:hypothetical protein
VRRTLGDQRDARFVEEDDHVPGGRQRGQPGADVDRDAADIVRAEGDLTGVQADPDLDPEGSQLVPDGQCAADAAGGRVKQGKEAVTGGVDLLAAVGGELLATSWSWWSSNAR